MSSGQLGATGQRVIIWPNCFHIANSTDDDCIGSVCNNAPYNTHLQHNEGGLSLNMMITFYFSQIMKA